MNGWIKGLIGAGGASLLAWGAHSATGTDYVQGIEEGAQSALAETGIGGAGVTMQRDPLARIANVTGVTDPAERDRIRAALLAVPGISEVRFEGDADGGTGGDGADGDAAASAGDADASSGASDAQVADCQGALDTFAAENPINFRSGSAYLTPAALRTVDGLAERLTGCTGMSVAVGGHTDATGDDATNISISQNRADAVAAALAERGVAAARITATGFGSSQPLVEGNGANEANRRIEFTLSGGE